MDRKKVYDEPGKVTADEGEVIQQGPDAVDIRMTPEAAEETSNRLLEGSLKARGQKRLKSIPHQPK